MKSVDWPGVIMDLRRMGYSSTRIHAMCGVDECVVRQLSCGATKEPLYSNGAALLELWLDVTRRVQGAGHRGAQARRVEARA